MKRFLCILTLLLATYLLPAQTGSWKIKLNGKTLLSTSTEDATANKKKLKASDWNKSGRLEVLFTENEKDTWIRSFLFYDKDDNEIVRRDSAVHAKISIKELKKLFAGKKEIIIYTTIAPVNPNIAIRMRRVHLCTLQLP